MCHIFLIQIKFAPVIAIDHPSSASRPILDYSFEGPCQTFGLWPYHLNPTNSERCSLQNGYCFHKTLPCFLQNAQTTVSSVSILQYMLGLRVRLSHFSSFEQIVIVGQKTFSLELDLFLDLSKGNFENESVTRMVV